PPRTAPLIYTFPYTTLFRSRCPRYRSMTTFYGSNNRADLALREAPADAVGIAVAGFFARHFDAISKGGKLCRSRSRTTKSTALQDRKSTRLNSSHQIISYAV